MKTVSKTNSLLLASMLATATFSGAVLAETTAAAPAAVPVAAPAPEVEKAAPVAAATTATTETQVPAPAAATTATETKAPTTDAAKTTAKEDTTEDLIVLENIQISGSARTILTNVHNARVALFEGQDQAAMQIVEKANAAFKDDVTKNSIKLEGDKGYGVPVDYSIEFAEDFKPTPDNAAVIAKAGHEAKSGNTPAAVKIMRGAGIELSIKYAMLPAADTVEKLDKVMSDLKEKKFYEANLALKSIETSVFVEDFEIDAAPEQGHDLTKIK